MNTTTATRLTASDITAGYDHDEWLGFGYLGVRRTSLDVSDSASEPLRVMEMRVLVADEMVLHHANRLGWTRDQFFAWLNSKYGRWTAEMLIVDEVGLDARTDGQLRNLMTLEGLVA